MEAVKSTAKIRKEHIYAAFVYLAVFVFMLVLNCRCGYITDDYHFRFLWRDFMPTENDSVVGGISDIFVSMENYYQKSGGRVIAHFVTYLMVNMNYKFIFNLLNSLMFTLLGFLIYRIAFMQERIRPFAQAMIYMSMFIFLPYFGDNVLWISGSVNYLWTGTLMMFCIYRFERSVQGYGVINRIILFPAVLISSSTNETTGGILFVWIAVYLISTKRKPDLTAVVCLVLCAVGAAGVVLAPGNAFRAEQVDGSVPFSFSGAVDAFKYYTVWLADGYLIPIVIASAGVILLIRFGMKKPAAEMLPWLISFVLGLYVLVLTGFNTRRPTFFPIMLLIAGTWRIAAVVIGMYRNGIPEKLKENSGAFYFSLVVGEAVFWGTERAFSIMSSSPEPGIPIAATAGILIGFALNRLLKQSAGKSEPFGVNINLSSGIVKKIPLVIKIGVIFLSAGYLIYNAGLYFSAMNRADEVLVLRYEEYLSGSEPEMIQHEYAGRLFPDELALSMNENEYTMKWIERCLEYGISNPQTDLFRFAAEK